MKPILFNTSMVEAILDGRKTTTRRVIKPQCRRNFIGTGIDGKPAECRMIDIETQEIVRHAEPPYLPGDILYVRETFCPYDADHVINGVKYAYKADATPDSEEARKAYGYKWEPSIFMPKEAARIFLRVANVKAERLQVITEGGAKAEGMVYTDFGMYQPRWKASADGGKTFHPAKEQHHFGWNSGSAKNPGECFPTSRGAFARLWDSTIKKATRDKFGWEANPWVWVISFERCEKPSESHEHH